VADGKVQLLNRQGVPASRSLPKVIHDSLCRLPGDWFLDGEFLDGVLYAFDLPQAGGAVSTTTDYATRRDVLERFFGAWDPDGIKLLPVAWTPEDKADLFKRVVENSCEGVILNDTTAPYRPGRRSSAILKVKLTNTADCVVIDVRRNGKDNMALAAYTPGGKLVEIAECTALAGDGWKVKIGDVVEVQYLYAVDRSRPRLVQPTKPLIRTDKAPEECLTSQLHFTNKTVLL
jgi:ATP-dependent DNA ligase